MLAADFGTGQVVWSLLWFAMLVIWVYLVIIVVMDVFRSRDLSNAAQFFWVFGVLVAPYIGVFLYLILRGHKITEHHHQAKQNDAVIAQAYVRQAAAGTGVAGELARLDDLRTNGIISDAEFDKRKAELLQG